MRELGRVTERAGGWSRPLGVDAVLVASGLMSPEPSVDDLLGD